MPNNVTFMLTIRHLDIYKMPYAVPISPIPSPAKETFGRKGWITPPAHNEPGPSTVTGPMPGIPRRSSSNYTSGTSTPRRVMSPARSRQSSATYQTFPSSRPMDGLPRRASADKSVLGVIGLPGSSGEGLGLDLHPTPAKARIPTDLSSSTSTVDSSLPSTPADEPYESPITTPRDEPRTIPFPTFEPPHKPSFSHPPHRNPLSPPRPALLGRRGFAQGHRSGHTGSLQMNISGSATQLPTTPPRIISSHPIRPTASMIRKKSGEVVKPSLKARSMSTPDLSRQDDAEPDTPENERERGFGEERSKSVRFADADEDDGRALESVVLFLREQKPAAVGKAADPEQAGLTETETEGDTDASEFVEFRTRRNAAARIADEAETVVLQGGSRIPRIRVDFAPGARVSLVGEHVVLERAELVAGTGPLTMRGSVIVRNLSYQKWVAVRFTLDHWQ